MIKLFHPSIGRLRLTKTKNLIHVSLIVVMLVALLSSAREALGQAVAPSNPFVILLDGIYKPAVGVTNLGLSQLNLNDGSYSKVTIYNLDSGFPGPTNMAVGTFYVQLASAHFVAYDLSEGAFKAVFAGSAVVKTDEGGGSWTLRGTFELKILEATGIYRSFAGGHIHMVDVLHHSGVDNTFLEHCFCHMTANPVFSQATRLANGQVQLLLNGEAGRAYRIEASTNLINWTALITANANATDGRLSFVDTNASNFNLRFYRAVAP